MAQKASNGHLSNAMMNAQVLEYKLKNFPTEHERRRQGACSLYWYA